MVFSACQTGCFCSLHKTHSKQEFWFKALVSWFQYSPVDATNFLQRKSLERAKKQRKMNTLPKNALKTVLREKHSLLLSVKTWTSFRRGAWLSEIYDTAPRDRDPGSARSALS